MDDPAWYDFARTAAREYPALIADLADRDEPDVSYRRVGALLLAGTGDQPEQARRRIAARSAGAPEMGEAGSGYDVRVTPGGLAEVLSNALSVAPGLSQGTLLETRVGLRPVGPDIRPLLGSVRGVDGLVVATGLGASGLTMGPLAGAVAARAALGLPPEVDLSPFDPLRS